jgi:pyridoxal phosphate enzyme (YggS family)
MNQSNYEFIKQNVRELLSELPEGVELVAAAKQQTPEKILAAVEAGVKIIGQNYVQEAVSAFQVIGRRVSWSFIGHLQKNKVKKAVEIFDLIETVDSVELAEEINKRCAAAGKIMPVLIEVNSGREPQKFGVWPEKVEELARAIIQFPNLRLQGLMTMGPFEGDPEESRPYFKETKQLFDHIRSLNLPGAEIKILSMGMTNSYRVAIEEGANRVRIGTRIFGPRQ